MTYACILTIIYQQFFLAHLSHTSIDLLFKGLRVIWFDDSFNLWKSFVGIHQYKKRPFCQLSQSPRTCPKDAPLMVPTIGKAFRQLRPLANKGLPLYLYYHMKQCAGFLVYTVNKFMYFSAKQLRQWFELFGLTVQWKLHRSHAKLMSYSTSSLASA